MIDYRHYQAPSDLLADRVIMITGAGSGIGRAATLTYAAHGATVILLGRTQEKLERVYDEIMAQGWPTPAAFPLDLDYARAEHYLEIANIVHREFGRLDGLLNNAGILGKITTLEQTAPEVWERVLRVNVTAAFELTRALLPALRESDAASVIFTTSSVGRRGRAYWGAYAVSKFATEGLMQTWADELENVSRIRFNAINPGATRTAMRAQAYPAEDPATLHTPESIMPTYLFLMGRDSENINGQSFDAQERKPTANT